MTTDPSAAASSLTAIRQWASARPWRSAVGLLLIYVGAVMEWSWLWGLLWLWWGVHGLRQGETAFFESVSRQRHPVVFWTLVVSWCLFGLWFIAIDLAPLLQDAGSQPLSSTP